MPHAKQGADLSDSVSIGIRAGAGGARRNPAGSLGDLRRAQPADGTTRNLLSLLTTKLETCASLPVWEWEAADEGHERCAAALHELAETERRSCADVLECLRIHLDRMTEKRA